MGSKRFIIVYLADFDKVFWLFAVADSLVIGYTRRQVSYVGVVMPIYEFMCQSCGASFELLAKFGQSVFACELCQSDQVRKVVSQTSFQLKGTGWAKDAYDNKASTSESAS